jgi:hypothetical protein
MINKKKKKIVRNKRIKIPKSLLNDMSDKNIAFAIRLTRSDRALINVLEKYYNIKGITAVVRFALSFTYNRTEVKFEDRVTQ